MEHSQEFNVGDILVYNIPEEKNGKFYHEIIWSDGRKEMRDTGWERYNHHEFEVVETQIVYCIDGTPFRAVYVRDITKNLGMFKIIKEQLSWFTKK